jgi:RND family efflux transporter MFP subunit
MKFNLSYGWMCGLILFVACDTPQVEQSADLTVPVTVQPVALGTIESVVTSTGTLRPVQEAIVVTEARGFLSLGVLAEGRKPTEGLAVEQGQVIARLDNEELMVGARLESRKLAVNNMRKTFDEKEVLVERGLVTQIEVETARKDLADAQSDYDDALLQIKKTKVTAPISGVLSEFIDATEKTMIDEGTQVCRIVDYGQVLVDLQIPNSQIRHIALGQPVRVIDYSYPDEVFDGDISSVDPVVDATTRTFRAVAMIDNPKQLLRPGMFVKAEIVVESHVDVVLVPREMVLMRGNREVVFVEESARAQMREIETGLEDEKFVEVLDGIEEGERLITSNYETLRSRTRVSVAGVEEGGGRSSGGGGGGRGGDGGGRR